MVSRDGLARRGQIGLVATLMLSSLLSLGYLMIIPVRAFFSEPVRPLGHDGIREAPLPSLIAIVTTAIACLALFLHPIPSMNS